MCFLLCGQHDWQPTWLAIFKLHNVRNVLFIIEKYLSYCLGFKYMFYNVYKLMFLSPYFPAWNVFE